MQAETLDEVIVCLDRIIQTCRQRSSRSGYFACLYRKMTLAIKEAIGQRIFEDAGRMEKLDVHFANRYLAAFTQFESGSASTTSWLTAFEAATTDQLTVFQHLLLGINAHINLDLGIAAARVSNPGNIGQLANDFEKVNEVIGNLFGDVQNSLARIAFPMYFIKKVDPKRTRAILNFSISKARETAWANALLLSAAGTDAEQQVITSTDNIVFSVAQGIKSPGRFVSLLLRWIRWTESKDVARNIDCLA